MTEGILVTGGAGFIGCYFVRTGWRRPSDASSSRQAHLRRLPANRSPSARRTRGTLRPRRHRRRRAVRRLFAEQELRRGRPLRRREPRRPLDRGPDALRAAPTSSAPSSSSRRPALLPARRRDSRAELPLPPRHHRRGLRHARRRPALHRRHAVRAELALFRDQGRGRPSRARLSAHLRPADAASRDCSNNYGPYQFPEKLIPLMILNALEGKPLPVYGDGRTCAIGCTSRTTAAASGRARRGQPGEMYNIGGEGARQNLDVVASSATRSTAVRPRCRHGPRQQLEPVRGRPPRPRPPLRHRRRQDPHAARLEGPVRFPDRPGRHDPLVPRQSRTGSKATRQQVQPRTARGGQIRWG